MHLETWCWLWLTEILRTKLWRWKLHSTPAEEWYQLQRYT
jgi:hypothetical protein